MKFEEDGTCKANTSDGKPKKLGERDIPGIALFSRTHCRSSLQDITNACPMQVSTITIRCNLHGYGIYNRIAVNKPFTAA